MVAMIAVEPDSIFEFLVVFLLVKVETALRTVAVIRGWGGNGYGRIQRF